MARRSTATISVTEARRIALAAQGFGAPRPAGRVDRRHFRRALHHMGLIQIDSVNVLVRSQELPLFARLGPHPRTLIPDAAADGELFEYWVHEASYAPVHEHHLHRHRMAKDHQWKGVKALEQKRPGFVEDVYRRVEAQGAVTSADLQTRVGKKGTWWDWDDGKYALEWLFWTGRLSATRRSNDFARVYDLTERIIPASALAVPTPPEHEARKELLVIAARCHGIGTLADLADYHRQKPTVVKHLARELVEEGRLLAVEVDGWEREAFLHPDAARPRRIVASALLSPFDPVVWFRDRDERLFDFHYRIEIYTPEAKRQYGYYVLPFLWNDSIVGRVDLKADRQRGVLMAKGLYGELGIPRDDVAAALAAELRSMAEWLGLDHGVEIGTKGDLAGPTAALITR